jgi:hypothetical protein
VITKGRLMVGRRFQPESPPVIAQPISGVGRLRKIAIIGSAQTVQLAPWYDASWEIWAHATVYPYCKRVDRYFDLHPWKWISEKPVPGYLAWLKTLRTPIYMQRAMADVPASIAYPRERVMAEHPRYFTSHAAWMIALALAEGVTHLGFFGIHYALDEEHKKQRAGCEFWMGVAHGRGVQLVVPEGAPLLREPAWLYGYESHSGKTHIRHTTGGKKPDMRIPPQNLALTDLGLAEAGTLKSHARTDLHVAWIEDRVKALCNGHAPVLSNGQPAW